MRRECAATRDRTNMQWHSGGTSSPTPAMRGLLVAVVAWTLSWKGVSLWRAAKDDSKPWFVTLLVTNTLGVLDAVYLFGVSRSRHRGHLAEESVLSATGEPEQLGHTTET